MAWGDDPELQDPFLEDSDDEAKHFNCCDYCCCDRYDNLHVFILSAIPFLLFGVVISMFTFVFFCHDRRVTTGIITSILLASCVAVMFIREKKPPEGVRLPFYAQLGLLGILAIGAGAALGFYNYSRHTSMWFDYKGQRTYTNVQPTDLALAHLDAGKIDFTKDARVARNMSAGYASLDGSMYAVAPIVDTGDPRKAEYFAAWICLQRNEINCEDAPSTLDRRGLVQLKKHASLLKKYRKAAFNASQKFGFGVSQDALFLSMSENPDKAQQLYMDYSLYFLAGAGVLYLVLSHLFAVMLYHLSFEPPLVRRKKKKQAKQ
mmetsp:Transcript_74562/g.132179  ORF Transcript_74562/g.132179 Transcript_74562/m.132179 type:complete len:319 (+) Transcript_74562:95-1051(+)